jgi:hypothetical protein
MLLAWKLINLLLNFYKHYEHIKIHDTAFGGFKTYCR